MFSWNSELGFCRQGLAYWARAVVLVHSTATRIANFATHNFKYTVYYLLTYLLTYSMEQSPS